MSESRSKSRSVSRSTTRSKSRSASRSREGGRRSEQPVHNPQPNEAQTAVRWQTRRHVKAAPDYPLTEESMREAVTAAIIRISKRILRDASRPYTGEGNLTKLLGLSCEAETLLKEARGHRIAEPDTACYMTKGERNNFIDGTNCSSVKCQGSPIVCCLLAGETPEHSWCVPCVEKFRQNIVLVDSQFTTCIRHSCQGMISIDDLVDTSIESKNKTVAQKLIEVLREDLLRKDLDTIMRRKKEFKEWAAGRMEPDKMDSGAAVHTLRCVNCSLQLVQSGLELPYSKCEGEHLSCMFCNWKNMLDKRIYPHYGKSMCPTKTCRSTINADQMAFWSEVCHWELRGLLRVFAGEEDAEEEKEDTEEEEEPRRLGGGADDVITGPREGRERAAAHIQHVVAEQDELGVTINIPDEATNSDEITVEGKKDGVKKAIEELKALVAKIENEKSKDLIIEQRLHNLIIGQGGKAINELRKQFPSVNFSFPDVNKKSDIINVRGDRKEVDDAAKALAKIAKDLAESNYQESVPIFKEFYKHIVGKGGSNIKKIREETATRIDLPDESSEEERIAVTGKKANVEKAIALLQKMQSELASVVTVEIEIPVKVQARMIGGGRRVLFDIEKECGGVYIKFPAEKSESTKVTINGPKEDVEKAQAVLLEMAKDREANFAEDTVRAKPEFHRFIIGKDGSGINKIKAAGNVRIMFPREADADKESIHLLGTTEEVVRAKAELETIIKQLNESVELKMEVDAKYHVHFKRVGAQLLKEIQDQNGNVVISFPGKAAEDQRTVTIKGIKQCCESAKARIEEIVDDMDHQTTLTVEIPAVHHRVLLSNRGQKVQEIQSRYNVRIRFPRRDAAPAEGEEAPVADDQIAIQGRDTACEKAAEDLRALVPISKTIVVPIDAHRFLIGSGGETIRKIMQDNDVNINVPKDEAQSEEITVSGSVGAVDGALEDIKAKLKEYEDQAEDRVVRAKAELETVIKQLNESVELKMEKE